MDRYALSISIPSTDVARNRVGLRHTAYRVELDDCGKIYKRFRRFTNFVWLHTELRRRELACALPELPPKKAVGNLDQAFVERRRQMLDDYLRALLRLPAVLQDDTLWAFLDADLATAVVPRFLCRSSSSQATAESLLQLELVVARDTNTFRLCSPAVLGELVSLAHREAAEAAVSAPPNGQATLQARLQTRLRLCSVVLSLIAHERARQGLVEAGMFGALLALMGRVTDDCSEASAAAHLSPDSPHRVACFVVTDCLQRLLEASRGAALLRFCQQDDGLKALKDLATADAVSLHPVAASLLWHGLQNSSVVAALVAASNCGLPLLGKLLHSPDVRARLLAALCVGCVLRQDSSLDVEQRGHCLRALLPLPADLDAAETAAIERSVAVALERAGSFGAGDGSGGGRGPPTERPAAAAGTDVLGPDPGALEASTVERDPALVALLKSLCSRKELPRLKLLMGDCEADAVTGVVVALVDHFARHASDEGEAQSARELGVLAPQLYRLLEAEDEGWVVESPSMVHHSTKMSRSLLPVPTDNMRVRAARILVRLDWPWAGSEAGGELAAAARFTQRGRVLEVLAHHSETSHTQAAAMLAAADQNDKLQQDHAQNAGLLEAPRLAEERIAAFGTALSYLATERAQLSWQVGRSRLAVEAAVAHLDIRGMRHGVIGSDVADLQRAIDDFSQDHRLATAEAVVKECEERREAAASLVEHAATTAREAGALATGAAERAQEAEGHAALLARREEELAEVRRSAPAKVEQLQARLVDCGQRRLEFQEQAKQLDVEANCRERRLAWAREAEQEADAALAGISAAKGDLQELQRSLNSELVLSEAEVERLREIEFQLRPARPTRLRRPPDTGEARTADVGGSEADLPACSVSSAASAPSVAGDAGTATLAIASTGGAASLTDIAGDAPAWDDGGAEADFNQEPHFRTFSRLFAERERLWTAERRWLQDVAGREEAASGRLRMQLAEKEREERAAAAEEQRLQRDVAALNDHEGHASRHAEARSAAAGAAELAQSAADEAARATGAQRLADAEIEQRRLELRDADAALVAARREAAAEGARALRARTELEAQASELTLRMSGHVREWRAMEFHERQLALLQASVSRRVEDEARRRAALRSEAHRLIEELHELDRQLDVQGPPGMDDIRYNEQWIHEAGSALNSAEG